MSAKDVVVARTLKTRKMKILERVAILMPEIKGNTPAGGLGVLFVQKLTGLAIAQTFLRGSDFLRIVMVPRRPIATRAREPGSGTLEVLNVPVK